MSELLSPMNRIHLVQGDITHEQVDAIVNAANSWLAGGGGVDGAIHRAAGPTLMTECRRIGGCPTGQAVATSAGNLQTRFVFHAVGPIYQDGLCGEPQQLGSAYRCCMQLARENQVQSIAFPSISTGVYAYPIEKAAAIALRTVADELGKSPGIKTVRFVLFDERTFRCYSMELDLLMSKEIRTG